MSFLSEHACKDLFLTQVVAKIDADIAATQSKLNSKPNSVELNAELESLTTLKKRVDNTQSIVTLYSSLRDAASSIKKIGEDAQKGISKAASIDVNLISAQEVKKLKRLQALKTINGGLDYFNNLKSLKTDLDNLGTAQLSPSTRRLAQSITVLTRLMSMFGDKAPLIGAFVKSYGDMAGGLTSQVVQLDSALSDIEQGQLLEAGNYSGRKELASKVPFCETDEYRAWRVLGVPNLYMNKCTALLWDDDRRDFIQIKQKYPNWSVDESVENLVARYLKYFNEKIKNPTPAQLLDDYDRTAVLSVEPNKRFVAPGELVEIKVTGVTFADSSVQAPPLRVRLRQVDNRGEFIRGDSLVTNQGKVIWRVPVEKKGSYWFEAVIEDNSDGPSWIQLRPARQFVVLAQPVTLQVNMAHTTMELGESQKIQVTVLDEQGNPLAAESAVGEISISCDACGNGAALLNSYEMRPDKGFVQLFKAPDTTGTVQLLVVYNGEFSKGGYAAARKSVSIEIAPPRFALSVESASVTVDESESASVQYTIRNDATTPLHLQLHKQYLSGQRPYWNIDCVPATIDVAPGGTEAFSVSFKATDATHATTQKLKITAIPNNIVAKEDIQKWSQSRVVSATLKKKPVQVLKKKEEKKPLDNAQNDVKGDDAVDREKVPPESPDTAENKPVATPKTEQDCMDPVNTTMRYGLLVLKYQSTGDSQSLSELQALRNQFNSQSEECRHGATLKAPEPYKEKAEEKVEEKEPTDEEMRAKGCRPMNSNGGGGWVCPFSY